MTLQFETTPLLTRGGSAAGSRGVTPAMKKYGKLVLVDLAGSERLKVLMYIHFTSLGPNRGSTDKRLRYCSNHPTSVGCTCCSPVTWRQHVICSLFCKQGAL